MNVPVLEAIADAIYDFEGNRPQDRAYRNRNPGDLRATNPSEPQDEGPYRIFPSFTAGYQALLHDLLCKVTGHNAHGLGPTSTLADLFNVYAPSSDANFPAHYALHVAGWLGVVIRLPISPNDSFVKIYDQAGEVFPVYVQPAA